MNKYDLDKEESVSKKFVLGQTKVLLTDSSVIVDGIDSTDKLSFENIDDMRVTKGNYYREKEGPISKLLQSIGLKDPPEYPIEIKLKTKLSTAKVVTINTTTKYEGVVDNLQTTILVHADC